MRQPEETVAACRKALAADETQHAVFNNLGHALRALGRFEEAREAYKSAIRLAPEKGAYYRNLVQSGPLLETDPHFAAMERLLQAATPLPPGDRIHLHFAMGQALEENGQHEAAFRHYLEGNALQRGRVAYDEATTLDALRRVRAAFTPELMESKQGFGDPSSVPVFIVGMPRSGSTLIEQILASHPDIFGAGERADFSLAVGQLVAHSNAQSDHEAVAALTADQLKNLGADYLRRIGEVAGAARHQRIADKYPFNFVYLGLIHMALPNARIIHSRRAPVETCLSCFSRLFEDVPFSYDLGELGRYYNAYQALMEHWRRVLPDGTMIEVDYEKLVADTEGETRRMLAYCGLAWNDACLSFHKTERVVVTESAAEVRQPIYRTSLTRWRPAPDVLQPVLDGLGHIEPGSTA